METTVQKTTTKGQITLPKHWRDQFKTNHFAMTPQDDFLVIRPLSLDDEDNYISVFDAKRDNRGKGMPAKKLLKILKSV